MGSLRKRAVATAVVVGVLGSGGTAYADPPPPPPGTPSIDQYVEDVPTSHGAAPAGTSQSRAKRSLPKRVERTLRKRHDRVSQRLKQVATSSAYGAPQEPLREPQERRAAPATPRPKISSPSTHPRPDRRAAPSRRKPPPSTGTSHGVTPTPPNALSAAVTAVGDSGDSHVLWLVGALVASAVAAFWAAARRPGRRS